MNDDMATRVRNALLHWMDTLRDPAMLPQLAALPLILLASWAVTRALRRRLRPWLAERAGEAAALSRASLDKFLFAGLCAAGALTASIILSWLGLPNDVMGLTAALAGSLLAVRFGFHVLLRAFRTQTLLVASEQLLVWLVWGLIALWLLGWLGPLTQAMDAFAFTVGGTRISLLDALRVFATFLAFVVAAAYAGALLESRLMKATQVPIGVRVGLAKAARFALIVLAALIAFNLLGVDLGGLAVFGGALGVGIGFGLQRIASNFISGFILIGDRSIRPGDVITIDERFGVVRELRARYVVVRDRDGVDTLIPNENIITSQVINWSYADRAVRLKVPVQISYEDNPRRAMEIMTLAAGEHSRVETHPAPAARVIGFGESGIDLELRFWIRDPEDGVTNVRSDLCLAILDAFRAEGITIPYPQRDVHVRAAAPDSLGGTAERREKGADPSGS